MGWEWRWLWRQANQSESLSLGQIPAIDLAVSEAGRVGAVALADGAVLGLRFGSEQQVVEKFTIPSAILGQQQATSVAISMKGEKLAIGTASGNVFVVSELDDLASMSDRVVSVAAHKRGITDICFGKDGTCGRLRKIDRFDHGSSLPMDLWLRKWLDGISFLFDKSR